MVRSNVSGTKLTRPKDAGVVSDNSMCAADLLKLYCRMHHAAKQKWKNASLGKRELSV